MEDYYEYLDSNGVTTLYKLIKDDTVALIDSYSVTINGITTTLDNHINDSDIHTPISDIESMVDTKIAGLVNSAPETLDTLKELSDALGNDPNFATTVANQIGNKASKDDVYTKEETDTLLEGKANSVHNHVVSDITDFPTIPTKTSELINDSGFLTSSSGVITSVSWSDITNKPNFSTVATSGSYTDLSNTPTIPTKVSQLENDMGFGTGGDTSDCVHKTGNETIDGIKTFTSGPWVTNNGTTIGFSIKNTAIGRGEVPSELYHNTFRVYDKNTRIMGEFCVEKSNSGSTLAQINVRSEDANGKQILKSVYFNMSNDGTKTAFYPNVTNVVDLGMAHYKWANAYIDRVVCTRFTHSVNNGSVYITGGSEYDKGATLALHGEESSDAGSFVISSRDKTRSLYLVGKPDGTLQWAGQNIALDENLVHTSGNETIAGNKTFTNQLYLGAGGGSYGLISAKDNNSILRLFGGTSAGTGANLDLYGENLSNGCFALRARTSDKIVALEGRTDGTLKWNGKNVALDENLVHRSGDETINGTKTFTQGINIQNSDIDLTATPTSNKYSQNFFIDKNNKLLGVVQYAQRSTDVNDLDLYVYDKNSTAHGIQITTNNELSPIGNNYSLGSSSGHKWANVYATTFNGKLKGNADTATKASYLDNYSLPGGNKIYLDWGQQVKGYVGLKVDNTVMGGLITTKNIGLYVNSVRSYSMRSNAVGSSEVDSSIAAYYSNAITLTAEGSSSSSGSSYPSDYSDYIDISPTEGTIYTGSQLFSTLNASASGSKNTSYSDSGVPTYQTTAKATATFSGAFSSSAKYLCTTANAVRFRAFVSQGTTSDIGTASVSDNSSARSIFIRVE